MKHSISVIAYDQVGNGYSDGIDGRRDYVNSMDRLSDDLAKIVNDAPDAYPGFCSRRELWRIDRFTQYSDSTEDEHGCRWIHHDRTAYYNARRIAFSEGCIENNQDLGPFFPNLNMPGIDIWSRFDEAFGNPR